jgi:DNA-binding response OmpR family regulator
MVQKPLVLIADDDRNIRRILKLGLEQDYRCCLAEDGLQAVEYARAESPDLILTDIMMPRLNGWEAIREIRSIGLDVPIIVMTGFADSWSQAEAVELGVTDCLAKPFSLYHLRELISKKIVPQA